MNWVAHIGRRSRAIPYDADTVRSAFADPDVRDRVIRTVFHEARCDFEADPPLWVGHHAQFGRHDITPATRLVTWSVDQDIIQMRTEPDHDAGTTPTRSALSFDVTEAEGDDGPFAIAIARWDCAVLLDVTELEFGPARARIQQIVTLVVDHFMAEVELEAKTRLMSQ